MQPAQIFRFLVIFAIVGTVLALLRFTDPRLLLRSLLERISHLGPWAPLWFILTYIVACLTFFPGVILTLGGGVLFGVVKGTFFVSIGATIGAGCAFLVSRYCARGWVVRKFANNLRFRAIDEAVAREGWKIVGLIRLSPAFPFIPLNFVFGLTKIPFPHFVGITWISIIPMSCLFVYLGSLLGDIAALGSQPMAAGKTKWIVTGIGLATTLVVTVLVTRIAARALAGQITGEPPEEPARES